MSLSTYSDLQTQVANWLARDDLTTYIPDFITLFEAKASRRLRVDAMEVVATATPVSGQAALPTDFLQMRRLTWLGTPERTLEYVAPQYYSAGFDTADVGIPSQYTIEAGTIKLKPIGDGTTLLEVGYYAKTAALSSALNWLYTNHPDAYLFGTLVEANSFNKGSAFNDAGIWKSRLEEVFEEIQLAEFRAKTGMSMLVMGVTP
jgi:hypothetical protein